MLEETLDVYRELQKHLDTFAVGFPPTESGVELRILKYLFNPKEAKLAIKLTDKFESVDKIYERANDIVSSQKELKEMLDNLVSKGSIHYKLRDGERLYANAYLVVGIYEYQRNRLTIDFLDDMRQYADEAFGLELFGYGITQLRTVPVEASVTPSHCLPTYDELTKIVENIVDPIAVGSCICRQAHEIREDPCKVTSRRETCLGFGDLAQMAIDEGWGRAVNREEALEILRKNQEEGLVLQGENTQRPGFICSCCGCCCAILNRLKEFPNVAKILHPRYYAEIDPELCIGCGTCIDRCNLDAIKSRKEKSKINVKRCIGCGNCIAVCPEDAIKLMKRDNMKEPPLTEEDMYAEILAAKQKMKGIK